MLAELDEALVAQRLLERADAGVFWMRQAFLGIYDLTLHGPAEVDPNALWFELTPALTPLPPPRGTIPVASFMPVMGGYDAGYYGYVRSRVYAQDMFSPFERDGLEDPAAGRRYRVEILEPGSLREPGELLRDFPAGDRRFALNGATAGGVVGSRHVRIRMPKWIDSATVPPADDLWPRWQGFIEALHEHELGHDRHGVEAAARQIVDGQHAKDLDSDRSARRGALQGAVF